MQDYFRLSVVFTILLMIFTVSCNGTSGSKYYPTYPSGGDYGGGGYDWYDDDYYVTDRSGEWEGFMWEEYRSDHRSLSKKKLAMRVQYRNSTWTSSGWHDWYKIDVLIDGRPAASTVDEIRSGGYFCIDSYQSAIDLELYGNFRSSSVDGDFKLDWDEKFKDPWEGDTIKVRVWISGDYNAGRVRGLHWASAWELFDIYGDGIWDLPDETWEAATMEGLAYLETIEIADPRIPVE